MEIRPNRTNNYVCSLDPMSAVDMEMLSVIRRAVKAMNSSPSLNASASGRYMIKKRKRVTVKGRGAIEKKLIVNRWTGKTHEVGYEWTGDIVGNKYTNSKRLDIYIHNDYKYVDLV